MLFPWVCDAWKGKALGVNFQRASRLRLLYLPVGVRERLRDESSGRQVIFMSFATLICQQFLPISNWKSCRCTGFSDLPRTFPLFSPESKGKAWESAVNSKWQNVCLAHQFCWMHRENTFSSFKYFLYEEGFDRYLRTSCNYSQIGK